MMEPYQQIIPVRDDLTEVGRVQEELNELWTTRSLPPDIEPSVSLALEEVLSNVLRHGASNGSSRIQGVFRVDTEGFEFEVSDAAPEYNPLTRPDPDVNLPLHERRPGGLGVYIVKQLADELSYERLEGRNRLRFRKFFSGDGGAFNARSE